MKPWEERAHKIIAAMSRASYEQANRLPNGKLRKRHRPYAIPSDAQTLVDCLGRNDEEAAKALFILRAALNLPDCVSRN